MSTDRLRYLLDSYAGGKCTEEEKRELHELLQDDWAGIRPGQQAPAIDWERMFKEIMVSREGAAGPVRRLASKWWYAAAAVLVVAIGAAILVSVTRNSRQNTVLAARNEILPGGNKAVLVLGNGQKIILDSAAAGTLAEQGGARVQKLGDGQLAYLAAGKAWNAADPGRSSAAPLYNTLTTPRGGKYQLTLPDGTKVWLNAASSLTYPTAFGDGGRTVEMTGEAYFEVAHDKKRPFTVKAGGQIIRDIGTHFNVNAYADEPAQVTTLLEGAVTVGGHLLRPGEKATVTGSGDILVARGDPDQAIAWKNGLFDFTDAGLETVMRQLSRWYNVDVTYEGKIPPRQFTGMIGRSLTLNQVLNGLAMEQVHYRIEEGNRLIITP